MLFGSYENIDILECFLSGVLNIPLEEITGNVHFSKNELDEKIGVVRQSVDVLVDLPTRVVHVEMNPVYYEWTNRRNFIYGVRIYENQFTNSEDYKKEVNYIQINLNGYEDDTINKTEEVYYVMSKEGKKWIKDFEIREINIPYCLKLWYDGDRREQVRWGSIFGCKDKKEFSEIIEDDGLMGKETKEKLENCVDKITHQTRYWWDYEKDEQMILNSIKSDAREEGHAEGRAEGLVEGRAEEKLETARKMKEEGIDINLISKITSLSLDEIKKI